MQPEVSQNPRTEMVRRLIFQLSVVDLFGRLHQGGSSIALPARASYLVLFQGPDGKFLAFGWEEDRVTVHGWSGATFSIHYEGKEIRSSGTNRVPQMPES